MTKYIKLFLRLAVSTAMLSAVADRFGLWAAKISVWGNMDNFLQYTQSILPYFPTSLANAGGWIATLLEMVFSFVVVAILLFDSSRFRWVKLRPSKDGSNCKGKWQFWHLISMLVSESI